VPDARAARCRRGALSRLPSWKVPGRLPEARELLRRGFAAGAETRGGRTKGHGRTEQAERTRKDAVERRRAARGGLVRREQCTPRNARGAATEQRSRAARSMRRNLDERGPRAACSRELTLTRRHECFQSTLRRKTSWPLRDAAAQR